MNRPRVVGKVASFHHIPYSLPDYPFPGLRVGGVRHGSPGLCVEGKSLRLERRRVEGLVIVLLLAAAGGGFHLEPPVAGIGGEGTKGAERGGAVDVGAEHK